MANFKLRAFEAILYVYKLIKLLLFKYLRFQLMKFKFHSRVIQICISRLELTGEISPRENEICLN